MPQKGLTGNLETMSLPDLLQWASRGQKSGTLVLQHGSVAKKIYFRQGLIVGSSSNDPRDYLGQVLLSEGLINETHLRTAMEQQGRSGVMLGRILVQAGLVTEARVAAVLRLKAEETIYSLFLWNDAEFEFVEGELSPSEQVLISMAVEGILLEGVRRYDTARRIRDLLPDNRLVLAHSDRPLTPDIAGKPFPRRLYDLIDGRRTIAEVILEAHASEFNVIQVLFVLVQRRHLAVAEKRSAAPSALPEVPAASADALAGTIAAAEEHLKRGDAEEALGLLDGVRAAGVRTPAVQTLHHEAERYFVERAYRFYLPPDKIPVLKRPLETLVNEPLSPEEFFLVSRVNGTWDLRSIMSISPLREVDALRALKRLRERGVIDLISAAAPAKSA
ncbi:MAG TPA: DUF4388 domain-containing protein [Dongiaceae bacterium]|nr:DUF4388 domain-containing protein [Dongiaceae bacterium]